MPQSLPACSLFVALSGLSSPLVIPGLSRLRFLIFLHFNPSFGQDDLGQSIGIWDGMSDCLQLLLKQHVWGKLVILVSICCTCKGLRSNAYAMCGIVVPEEGRRWGNRMSCSSAWWWGPGTDPRGLCKFGNYGTSKFYEWNSAKNEKLRTTKVLRDPVIWFSPFDLCG